MPDLADGLEQSTEPVSLDAAAAGQSGVDQLPPMASDNMAADDASTGDGQLEGGLPEDGQPPEDDELLSPAELEEMRASEVAFSWQASEYVHHQKSASWYMFGAAILIGLVVIAILSKYWVEIGMFLVMAAAVVVYARKPPRLLSYELTHDGILVEGRLHEYSEFRSFGVLPDIEWHTIDLEPARRLSPRLAILFDEQDFDTIIGHLELHLPRVDRMPDPVEQLSRYIRF